MRVLPKGILNHPGVEDAVLDDDCESGYRADVLLKPDWHFAGLDDDARRDNPNKRRTGFFLTLQAFKDAKPTQYT